jgi:hypothetical protein
MAKLKPNQFYLPSGALITEHPILFQTEMVQAILADRKSQTRRDRNLDMINENPEIYKYTGTLTDGVTHCFARHFKGHWVETKHIKCPFGKPGDLLWAKETWNYDKIDLVSDSEFHIPTGINCAFVYKAENPIGSHPEHGKMSWKPSIHMPKSASRIWLMIEDIRVERLQDISEEDALAEGVLEYEDGHFKNYFTRKGLRTEDGVEILLAKGSFQSLICTINGMEIWDKNRWVWVIKYRVLSKTGRPSMDVIEKNYLEVTSSSSGKDQAVPEQSRGGKEVYHG